MRVIKSGEKEYTCKNCHSTIGILPNELHTVSGPGYYDMDVDDNVGQQYWSCPVCHNTNYIAKPSDRDDYDY